MQESHDLSHQETQTLLPGPLGKVGFWDKVGTWALPASSLSLASVVVLLVTVVFLRRSEEMQSLFMLPRWRGIGVAVLASLVAWGIVVVCGRRPGRLWPRLWALFLASLNSALLALLIFYPEVTWINAGVVAGAAATATLAPRLVKLAPDNSLIPMIAPLTTGAVLVVVLPFVWWVGESITAGKRARVSDLIDQLREWTAEVQRIGSRDWSTGGWDDAAREVEKLRQIQLARNFDVSLWREAFTLQRDQEVAAEAVRLLGASVAALHPDRVPRVSRLRDPAFYYDPATKKWEESSVFPGASATVGLYFQELGRIFQELGPEASFPESTGLEELKKSHLDQRTRLEDHLRPQMEDWTDHWAVFRVPGQPLGLSEMPLGKLLKASIPVLQVPVSDLPGLLGLTYNSVRDLGRIPGCHSMAFYEETKNDGTVFQYGRLDCYSYAPRPEGTGAYPRIEMRLVYQSAPNGPLRIDQKPTEVYFLFPLPEGQEEGLFKKQVMADLADSVQATTRQEVVPRDRSGSTESGFRIPGGNRRVIVYEPRFISLFEDRRALIVRAERQS